MKFAPAAALLVSLSIGALAQAAGGYPAPEICDRECWEARPPQGTVSQMAGLTRAVIHHTAFADQYYTSSLEESAANVRGVQNYHMDVNGWTDIGYHFLGDTLGNAFEGRPGSIESYPRGAHDGTNDQSFGFCMMGYFHTPEDQEPTEALRCTIYDLIAWRIPDPFDGLGSSFYAGSTTGYVAGHRDVAATACPGDLMWNQYIGSDYQGGEARIEISERVATGAGLMCGGGPQCCPGAPTLDGAFASGSNAIALSWGDLGAVEGYRIYRSPDGVSFARVGSVGSGETSFFDRTISPGTSYFYRVTAVGSLYESAPSDVYGARTATAGEGDRILFVDGDDRWRTQGENPEALNHAFLAQGALALPEGFPFDAVDNELVEAGDIALGDYAAVVWLLGEESTIHETFSSAEQGWVRAYRAGGGNLFVSGSEVGWDLVAQGSASDRAFFEEVLLAQYVADDANTTDVAPVAGGPFAGLQTLSFLSSPMVVEYPDVIAPTGGSAAALSYTGGTGELLDPVAGVAGPGLIYLAFPFESLADAEDRAGVMAAALTHFGLDAAGPTTRVHVASVALSVKGQLRNRALATVTIHDAQGQTVEGAIVSGHFEGVIDEDVAGTTLRSGTAPLLSSPFPGETQPLSFCVDVVSGAGLSYDEAADLAVCAEL